MRDISLTDNVKDQEEELQVKEMCIKECFQQTRWKVKVCFTFQTEGYMKATFCKAKNMEKEDTFGQTDRYMKGNSKMTNVLELVLFIILMEKDLKETGKMAKKVVKELIFFQMDLLILLFIKEVKKRGKQKWKKDLKTLRN